jgi:hypothetical protein
MLIITYIIRLLAPIVTALGFIGIFAYGIYVCDYILYCEDPSKYVADTPTTKIIGTIDYANGLFILYLSIALFIVGIIYGIYAYKNDIPLRWAWAKSKNSLFSFSISTILGYGLCFAAYPYAFFFIHYLIKIVQLS